MAESLRARYISSKSFTTVGRHARDEEFLDEEGNSFTASLKIGTALRRTVSVYYADENDGEDSVVLMVVPAADLESLFRLQMEVYKSSLLGSHPNILGVRKSFMHDDNFCCVVSSRINESIRYFMRDGDGGVPQDFCITVVLREVIKGLLFIHESGHFHGNLTLGHVYLKGDSGMQIILGYGASAFEFDIQSSRDYLPPDYELDERSDIWMVGLMGLELAYGELCFKDLNNLDSLLRRINETKKLPSRALMKEYQRGGFFSKIQTKLVPPVYRNRTDIDASICNMLALCFDPYPSKRPTARQLLNHEAFIQCQHGVEDFYSCMSQADGKKDCTEKLKRRGQGARLV